MIVAGFGFRASATLESLQNALELACGQRTPNRLATVEGKAKSPVFQNLAMTRSLPVSSVSQSSLEAQKTQTQSEASRAAWGTGSVAEAAALAVAGSNARLIAARVVSEDGCATCALAEGETA